MVPIGKEATDFVHACEAIHRLLETGTGLHLTIRTSLSLAAVNCWAS